MVATMFADIESLMPVGRPAVMDLVASAGIDVSAWLTKKNGAVVKRPKANPKFCYEWAYGSKNEALLFCIWHESLTKQIIHGETAIVSQGNMRSLVAKLETVANDKTRPTSDRNRARDQARRGRVFDDQLNLAHTHVLPVRMVINHGMRRAEADLGTTASTVKARMLDSVNWFIHQYDTVTGDYLVVRGIERAPDAAGSSGKGAASAGAPKYVDQFSELQPAGHREATVTVRDRSAAVRQRVLARSKGLCELCLKPGFRTSTGSTYLETHHVVPLAEDGPDVDSNVVALCPDDHRRAHFAAEKAEIAALLVALLASLLPHPVR